jgi:tetratricopeptide (TPR) repeat protein
MTNTIRFNARAIAVALAIALTLPASAQLADGDRHYAARADGAQGARANARNIDAAIAAYQRATASNPNDLVAHARLLRAYRFKGAYTASSIEEKKKVYSDAKTAGTAALSAVSRALAGRRVKSDAPEKVVAEAVRSISGAADIYLWDAINWGEWALAYGKLAAARQGAADRIRRGATIAHLANPALEGGAASRVLGRLHDQTPRIPFVTGWASSKEALRFLQESLKHDPKNKLTQVFLAEAMVSNDAAAKARAAQMLRAVVAAPLDEAYLVEDAAAVEDAKALLAKWK